ncbi:hypothetical protein N7495_008390 [Penicillium taxi]|uniref:uncharacterized protein n=1 Tax=Penicillium taxi TaxID=168475 RepID=UPI00254533FA|nr:uncharacterized protein N7495_008390 [Penicillium taxi]KAJ5888349.1 hypothetical protein N7495_008390 [Penicillium taxi]
MTSCAQKDYSFYIIFFASSTSSIDSDKTLLESQAVLYRSCLVYLATANFPHDLSDDSLWRREELVQKHPFLAYAITNLFIHAGKPRGSRQDAVQNELDMLHQVIDRWVKVYNILHLYNLPRLARGTTLLHMAAARNLVDVIESLVSNGADVAKEDEERRTAFHFAAQWGHVTAGRILLEKEGDREGINRHGTLLRQATSWGHVGFVEWLLDEEVNIENLRNDIRGALRDSAIAGHETFVKILIGSGADVNARGGEYSNTLQAVAYRGRAEILQMLLDAHADVNAQGGQYGNALQAAAGRGRAEIVQMLLDAHADVSAQGGQYGNALQAASARGNPETVQILLNAHADVNAQVRPYSYALLAAAGRGNIEGSEIVRMLIDAHADINARGRVYGHFSGL